jgi:hypothetical protein
LKVQTFQILLILLYGIHILLTHVTLFSGQKLSVRQPDAEEAADAGGGGRLRVSTHLPGDGPPRTAQDHPGRLIRFRQERAPHQSTKYSTNQLLDYSARLLHYSTTRLDFSTIRLLYHPTTSITRLFGYSTRLLNCPTSRPLDYSTTRLHYYSTTRPLDPSTARLLDNSTTRLHHNSTSPQVDNSII